MVAKQIPRELADMLTRDPIMQRAVLPEAALGADHYLSSLTTIADVELSNDLQVTPGPSLETMRLRCNLGWLVVGGDAELLVSASVCVCRCARCMCLCLGTRGGRKWPWPGSRTRPVRSQIGKRMKLRLTPKIWFIEDESMERGSRVCLILFCQALACYEIQVCSSIAKNVQYSSSCTITMSFHPFFIFR
uniref:Uncharacterized protein n=1 Tax=Aegilops tauschii subsp. strangulata TaxID=200361 RepID=A0A453AE90_AEGTS